MKITDITSELMGDIQSVENGVHKAIEEFNQKDTKVPVFKREFDSSQAIAMTCRTSNDLAKLGMGPFFLYHRYVYHSKIQRTNQIWTTDSFMAKDAGTSVATIERYKKILKKAGFIEVIRTWDNKTRKLGKSYVKLNKLLGGFNSNVVATIPVDSYSITDEGIRTPSKTYGIGKRGTNALTINKDKCLNDNKMSAPLGTSLINSDNTHEANTDTDLQLNGFAPSPHVAADPPPMEANYIKLVGYPVTEREVKEIQHRLGQQSVAEHIIKNRQADFNQWVETLQAEERSYPKKRRGYIRYFANYIRLGHKYDANRFTKRYEHKQKELPSWYDDDGS